MSASRRYNRDRLAATFVLLVWPSLASAADEASAGAPRAKGSEALHFEYVAPPECPPADRFLGQISAYTTRWTLARPGEEARRFIVRIDQRERVYVGHFDVRAASGARASRDIEGATCDEAALGLAVAVALAIEPNASLVPEPSPASESTSIEPSTPAPPPPDEGANAAPRAKAPPDMPIVRPPSSPSRAAVSVGGRAEANGAVSGVLAVVDVFVELEWIGALARVPSLRPAIRGGWRNALTRTQQVGTTRAEIDWAAGYLEACPARFAVTSHVAIEGCVGGHLGLLSGQPLDLRGAGITRRTWLDYGGLLGARWQPDRHLFVEAVAAVWAPITRDRLRIEPDGLVTRAPAAGISAGIGGGWRF
ncbi:MAG: hypothetical protein BGO98_07325 [Myxococcales bacterium 68-20]|nr:MAG: hypothetical protein BGO98_07325 [Myxococcales bacterium 68-20]